MTLEERKQKLKKSLENAKKIKHKNDIPCREAEEKIH